MHIGVACPTKYAHSSWFDAIWYKSYLFLSFKITSLWLVQFYHCPISNEVVPLELLVNNSRESATPWKYYHSETKHRKSA